MTARERALAALRGERVRPVPCGAATQAATLSQMNDAGAAWPEAHSDAALMASLAASAHTKLGFDLLHVPFDQTVEAGSMGAAIEAGDKASNSSVREHPFALNDPLPPVPDLSSGRARVVAEAIGLLRARLDDGAAVLGGIVGPFTLVCQLAGVTQVVMDALRKPALVRPWLDFAVEVGIEYARRQVEAGADAITVEDMSASLDLTSPRIYQNLILPAQQKLIAAIGAPAVLHVCGSNTKILPLLAETGAAALSLEARTDLHAAVGLGRCAIVGGVPTVEVLLRGGPEDVRRSATECLVAGVHTLAPGCAVPPATPSVNLEEMVSAAHDWNG